MADVVIVVDMVRGFLEEGYPLSCGEAARRVIDPVGALIEERLGEGDTVLFTCDAHEPSDPEIALRRLSGTLHEGLRRSGDRP